MEKVASCESHDHVVHCWLNIVETICAFECCTYDEHHNEQLDAKNGDRFEKVVMNVEAKIISICDIFNHWNKCQGVDTVIESIQNFFIPVVNCLFELFNLVLSFSSFF